MKEIQLPIPVNRCFLTKNLLNIKVITELFDEELFYLMKKCLNIKYVVHISSSNVKTRILKTHHKKSRQAGFFRGEFLKF